MTAVEYLVELLNFDGYVSEDTINKAKEMEKQQIINAGAHGDLYGTAKDYYKQLESKK